MSDADYMTIDDDVSSISSSIVSSISSSSSSSSSDDDSEHRIAFESSVQDIVGYEDLVFAYLKATNNTINVRHDWEWLQDRFGLTWRSVDELVFRVLCKRPQVTSFLAIGDWNEDETDLLDSRFFDGCRTLKIFSDLLQQKRGFLRHLSIRNMCFRDYCFESFSLALQHNHRLLALDLSGNSLTDYHIKLLAKALVSDQVLQSLDLQYNSFGDAGGRACIELLRENKTLTTLDLKASDLSRDVVQEIYELFSSGGNISLHTLFLRDMPGLRDFRLEQLCEHVARTNFYLEKLTSVESLAFLIHDIAPRVFKTDSGKRVPNELKARILADAFLDHEQPVSGRFTASVDGLKTQGRVFPLPRTLLPEAKKILYDRWVDVLHLGLSFASH